MSNGSSFSWIVVISANFKGSGKATVLRESFIRLQSIYGNILFPFKIFKGMSPPDDFVSSNVEILGSKLPERRRFNCNVFAYDLFYTWVVFVLINNTFDWVWFI